jgi:hypothetical protein
VSKLPPSDEVQEAAVHSRRCDYAFARILALSAWVQGLLGLWSAYASRSGMRLLVLPYVRDGEPGGYAMLPVR